MTKFRHHRGQLDDSMKTVVEVADRAELVAMLKAELDLPNADEIEITPYAFDSRIGWDTYLVSLHGYGVIGMTDGPC